ncbi:receptor-transporting protein 3-like [Labrus mixtus]|uniref:receptor-transporting protein 3-like n=1 Tax=Labrus mixtus TaxID=508554 RepID=UPI0029C0C491|nr:receptor-transporting protein 3-like [Labrus mixtus]
MAEPEWTSIFQNYATSMREGDSWCLQFDNTLVPNSPKPGWKQYIKNTAARFRCTKCGRSWPSNKVMVVFHMQLNDGQGVVKVRRFRQDCKKCDKAPMEKPSITPENINVLMESLVEKIRIKCYHEDLGQVNHPFQKLDVKSPHEPTHCEACREGICTQEMQM